MRRPWSVVALVVAGAFLASWPVGAGDLRWGARAQSGSGTSWQGSASPGRDRPTHHDWHGGTHRGWHQGSHWSSGEGWHSGRHHGAHKGMHHDWHDRSHAFEHGSSFRFGSRRPGFSFGLEEHASSSSFGAAGPPPWGAAGPSPWGAAGPPPFAPGRKRVVFISTPFFCHPHGLGFTHERDFVSHLHREHGLSEDRALASCHDVGGKLFFFGF